MKKFIATVVATGLLLAGAATAPAGAETLYRNGSSKVTIKPVTAPAGAATTKARITVKKGKKTVAKTKISYRAKKGKYKVTSTVSYFFPAHRVQGPATSVQGPSTEVQGPATTKVLPVTESDSVTEMLSEKCTVTGRTVANRTVQAVDFYDATGMADWATVRGQAVITYTGDCTAGVWAEGKRLTHAWTDDWTELGSVYEVIDMTASEYAAFNAQAWLESELAKNSNVLSPHFIGDEVSYPGDGTELDKAGSIAVTVPGLWTTVPGAWTTVPGEWQTIPATAVTTTKSVRTVRVK